MQLLKFIDQIANAWVPLLARSGENILKKIIVCIVFAYRPFKFIHALNIHEVGYFHAK